MRKKTINKIKIWKICYVKKRCPKISGHLSNSDYVIYNKRLICESYRFSVYLDIAEFGSSSFGVASTVYNKPDI